MIGKFRTRVTAVVAGLAIVAAVVSPTVSAAPPAPPLSIPVVGTGPTGATFAGTMTLTSFAVQNGQVVARGLLTGILTDAAGTSTTIVSTLATPVDAAPPATSCRILYLDLAPLYLGVLGLEVNLSQVVLDLSAQAGAGNLLGNLLCTVTGLLDNPATLGAAARILNQVLDVLAGL